jgi:protein ImuA
VSSLRGPGRPAPPPPVPATPAAPAETGPEHLHPALWRAHQVARGGLRVLPSRFAELDAALPGGGWPVGALAELLLPHPGVGELRLLAPALAAVQQAGGGLMWFDPPALPCAWALADLGLDARRLVVVRPRTPLKGAARERLPAADMLWALEQALRSGQAGAVLGWLPARLPADALRRLQLAAQGHDGPAFLLRHPDAARQPSAAPLRLQLAVAVPDALRLTLLKRRGPPAAAPLLLALPPELSASAWARAEAAAVPVATPPAGAAAAGPAW